MLDDFYKEHPFFAGPPGRPKSELLKQFKFRTHWWQLWRKPFPVIHVRTITDNESETA